MQTILSRSNITIFFLAIIICANPINWIFKIPNGLAIIVFISFCIITILNLRQLLHNINSKVILLILYFSLFYIISLFQTNFHPQTIKYLTQFIILGILPLVLSSLPFQHYRIYGVILLLGIIFISFAFNFSIESYYSQFESDIWGFIMGVSYGLLRFIVAGMIILFFYPPKKFLFKIIVLLEIAAFVSFLVLYGTRGAILSSILLLVSLFVLKKHKYLSPKSILLLLFTAFFFFVIWVVFLSYVYPMLQDKGINFIFIDKTFSLLDEGDVSSGRIEIAKEAIKAITKRPFYGYGIGSFDNYSGGYPHNLFLHFLYEGGIFLCLPFIVLISKSFYIIFSKHYEFNYRIYVIFLFFSSVIELLFSSQPWISQIFWLYIGSIILSNKYKNKHFTNEYSINTQS